jgi:hypothetical protein
MDKLPYPRVVIPLPFVNYTVSLKKDPAWGPFSLVRNISGNLCVKNKRMYENGFYG